MGLLQDTKNRIFIDSHHHFFNPDAWLSVHENQQHNMSAGGERVDRKTFIRLMQQHGLAYNPPVRLHGCERTLPD